MDNRFCIIMPCYEKHALMLESTLHKYLNLGYPIIVIDDGSSSEYKLVIEDVTRKYNCTLITTKNNSGKGHAIKQGLQLASELNFSHAIQIDSDGQHNHQRVNLLIQASRNNPNALISGIPLYNESIPKARFYGRYLTHFWVWIHTLSFDIKDSMCGFRVYPLIHTNQILKRYNIGNKMDFDIEILVHHHWGNVKLDFIDIEVDYPADGTSYFNSFHDNVLISKMHTKLFFSMLIRIPMILKKKLVSKSIHETKSWHDSKEKGSLLLMFLTLKMFKLLGVPLTRFIGKIISFYYSIFSSASKKNSKRYQFNYQEFCRAHSLPIIRFNYFNHVSSFTNMVIDKLGVWNNQIKRSDIHAGDLEEYYKILNHNVGKFFISSHFGNIEVIRSLGHSGSSFKINALMHTGNSKKIFSILSTLSKEATLGIIEVDQTSPGLAINLKDKLEANELIFCMGDRVTINSNKTLKASLLDKTAILPYGPFILAHVLNHPIYAIHCYKEKNIYRIKLKELISNKELNKNMNIQSIANQYIDEVQSLVIKQPTQWFNFTNIWANE